MGTNAKKTRSMELDLEHTSYSWYRTYRGTEPMQGIFQLLQQVTRCSLCKIQFTQILQLFC